MDETKHTPGEVKLRYSLRTLRINSYKTLPQQSPKIENIIFSLMRQAHRLGVRTERSARGLSATKSDETLKPLSFRNFD